MVIVFAAGCVSVVATLTCSVDGSARAVAAAVVAATSLIPFAGVKSSTHPVRGSASGGHGGKSTTMPFSSKSSRA